MHRNPAFIELPAEKFEQYLAHEGLTSVVEARRDRDESAMPGRERYQRYLKLWLPVGETSDATHGVVLGFDYELILRDRPAAGAPLRIEARFRGEPLTGAPITLISGDASARPAQRTDDRGRVMVANLTPGTWLVRGVHMVRSEHEDADWDSFWAAFSFEVPPPPAGKPVPVPPPHGGCAGCQVTGWRGSVGPVKGSPATAVKLSSALLALVLLRRRQGSGTQKTSPRGRFGDPNS